MAQTATTLKIRPGPEYTDADIDWLLAWAFGDWRDLEEIEVWEPTEQADELVEWPLAETRLRDLESYAEQMTVEQRARYAGLLRLVEKNRPILERIREAVAA